MLQIWLPNTLPLPYPAVLAVPQAVGNETVQQGLAGPPLVDDNFPKGQIVKYFPHQGYGFMVDRMGSEVYFGIAELDFVGVKGRGDLKVGAYVGYDVSWTSHGLHVKRMKIY